jgi:hypothetical protein
MNFWAAAIAGIVAAVALHSRAFQKQNAASAANPSMAIQPDPTP